MDVETCVSCGAVIPEGRHYCSNCEEKTLTVEEIVKALKFAIAQGEPDGIGFWNSNMKWCGFSMSDVLKLVNRQKAEIERLKKGQDESAKTAVEVLEQNLELQKQVDELKKDREALFNEMSERMKAEVAIEKKLGIRKCEQAVKDTAKEILAMFEDRNYISEKELKQAIAEHYGVEVE